MLQFLVQKTYSLKWSYKSHFNAGNSSLELWYFFSESVRVLFLNPITRWTLFCVWYSPHPKQVPDVSIYRTNDNLKSGYGKTGVLVTVVISCSRISCSLALLVLPRKLTFLLNNRHFDVFILTQCYVNCHNVSLIWFEWSLNDLELMNTTSVWGKKLSLKSHKHVSMNRWKNAEGYVNPNGTQIYSYRLHHVMNAVRCLESVWSSS